MSKRYNHLDALGGIKLKAFVPPPEEKRAETERRFRQARKRLRGSPGFRALLKELASR